MRRAMLLVAAAAPGVMGWAWVVEGGLLGWSVLAGFAALLSGTWLLHAKGPAWFRLPMAAASLGALVCTTGLELLRLAPEVPRLGPLGLSRWYPLGDYTLPACFHAVVDTRPREAPLVVIVDCRDELFLDGGPATLADVGRALAHDARPLRLYADRGTPWVHVCWILDVARKSGRSGLALAATRWAGPEYVPWGYLHETLDLQRVGEALPPGVLPVLLTGEAGAGELPVRTVRILVRKEQLSYRGKEHRKVSVPTQCVYELDGRTTLRMAELCEWLREASGGRPFAGVVRASRKAPAVYVVAVLEKLLGAGAVALATDCEPPPAEVLSASVLPYPERNH